VPLYAQYVQTRRPTVAALRCCLLQVLQLASHLRRAGYFVLAALTLPFDFEGRRKVEEAAALVEALQDVANLVVRHASTKSCNAALATYNCSGVHAWQSKGGVPCTAMPAIQHENFMCRTHVWAVWCPVPAGGGAAGCAGARLSRADSHTGA
jgi:hypothetical protein